MTMKTLLRGWLERYFSDEEAVVLFLVLVLVFAAVIWLGSMLAPFFTALIVAFLLQSGVSFLERFGLPRLAAVSLMTLVFMGIMLASALILLPLVWHQLANLIQEIPGMFASGQRWLGELQQRFPGLITPEQVQQWVGAAGRELTQFGQRAVSLSLASLGNLMGVVIYLVLVPILVFFMLKDRERLVEFTLALLPRKRLLMSRVWNEMDDQIANFVRGKVIEIVIVGGVSYVTFVIFGLPYSALLAIVVGFSVLIPYIGAAGATLPVAAVAGFHFGLGDTFMYVMIAYGIIQALDGNVLVPLLFSEAVNLHPVAIILAVLFFGGIWGFWGVFFAIPLATLMKSLLYAWPRRSRAEAGLPEEEVQS
ncbi:AI-2E family transporter [Cobetia marina]|jgi:putative permease|uniref:AI-2E family transporter n=1 Tax=Cobetia TaxID=204286 RepID=UPI000984EBD1|nr:MULTISPECIES: AI-2E family transporter [Cobetia]MDA5565106.1 AI-2E family transporter [Cobetia sp. MMG027]MDH2375330.1 AI-2E family transporter [Cobetia sp. 3AK]POR04257.1 AI-2E family transporter [Cobetia sp. MM1IDA2H-1]TKD60555.1 AI-2E family transporter [Cobetia marina]